MKYILLFIACFAMYWNLQAQQETNFELPKWQVGLDVLPYFDTSSSIKNSILIRKVINESTSLRSNLGIAFENINNRPNDKPETSLNQGSELNSYLSVGLEHYLFRKRVSVYFGGEVFGSYYRILKHNEVDTRPDANPPTIFKIDDLYQTFKLGMNGLSGFSLAVAKNFNVNVEAKLILAYQWEQGDYKQYEGPDYTLTVFGGRTIKRTLAKLIPLSGIYLVYDF